MLGEWGGAGNAPGELAHPWDIETGPGGTVYVADCDNHRVQVYRRPAWLACPEGVFRAGSLLAAHCGALYAGCSVWEGLQ